MSAKPGVMSLFSGAGGLDLGLEAAGFSTLLCVENDRDALATLSLNRPRWKMADPNDALDLARAPLDALASANIKRGDIAVLAGGPPCQPFSKAGYWSAKGAARMEDPRAKTIGAYIEIVNAIRPEVLLFENVSAFAYKGRDEGLTALLRGVARINKRSGSNYQPQVIRINAADFGVPQLRERIFVIAHRRGRAFVLPDATHGPSTKQPYATAWDAIGQFDDESPFGDDLRPQGRWADLLDSIPEGQNYLWHTPGNGGKPLFGWRTRFWSFLLKLSKSMPGWTIPAVPGPATGPFHWRSRLLSVTELCRLQTFPAGYRIAGSRRACQRQIGNAVPAALAEFLGLEIRRQLLGDRVRRKPPSLLHPRRDDCPPPEPVSHVPATYLHLIGDHKPHPGPGKGPGRTLQ